MAQHVRHAIYTATAIGAQGGPLVGFHPGPQLHDVTGAPLPASLVEHSTVPAGTRLPVRATTTAQGPAWEVASGPYAGLLVPAHHPAWSVNP